ncbi:MAG: response regulator transcription factor [Acidobacteriia bacterium]|nr:response regulator transcription factor [Terriglobia bacterium]
MSPGEKKGAALRILVVDDHAVVRQGIIRILASDLPGAILAEAGTGQEAIDATWKEDWDLILLDISLPGRCGIDVLKEIKSARPKVPILIVSMHSEGQFAIRALKGGAAGYLTKDSPHETLIYAVRRLLGGGKFISATLAEKLAVQLDVDTSKLPHESLSDREFEVLRMLGSGRTVGEIAQQLFLSVKTISTYRARILTKMGLTNNAELVQYCIRNSLVD